MCVCLSVFPQVVVVVWVFKSFCLAATLNFPDLLMHTQLTFYSIVCISDTHNRHATLQNLPFGDILCHTGDVIQTNTRKS